MIICRKRVQILGINAFVHILFIFIWYDLLNKIVI